MALSALLARTLDDPKVHARDMVGLTRRLIDVCQELDRMREREPSGLVIVDERFDPEAI